MQEHLQLYEPNNSSIVHAFNPNPKSTIQQPAFEPSSNSLHPGYEPLNVVVQQGYDQQPVVGAHQGYDQPPGVRYENSTAGGQQGYDNSTAVGQQEHEPNGPPPPQVQQQSYELLSSAVNAHNPASTALQKGYDPSMVQHEFDHGYYDQYVDQEADRNSYGVYSGMGSMIHQGYETNNEGGGALDARINIAKSRLDPNVRSVPTFRNFILRFTFSNRKDNT